jgi:hypothetical protein
MIQDRPDRVPDSIEPLVGYRAWFFTNNVHGALLSLGGGSLGGGPDTAWEGANRHWVSADCPFGSPERESASMRARLEQICSKLGYLPESILDRPPHVIPGEDCSCGFYAMKTLSRVQQLSMELRWGPDLILGRVALAGKVIEYTVGYRAARARIAALIPMRGDERTAKRLADDLGLPLDPVILRWSGPEGLPPAA